MMTSKAIQKLCDTVALFDGWALGTEADVAKYLEELGYGA